MKENIKNIATIFLLVWCLMLLTISIIGLIYTCPILLIIIAPMAIYAFYIDIDVIISIIKEMKGI